MLVLLTGATPYMAALPGWVVMKELYEACLSQASSPEVVKLRVLEVDTESKLCHQGILWFLMLWNWQEKTLHVTAMVTEVHRSKTNIRPGKIIRFSYILFRLCPGWVGPANRPQPIRLSSGDVVWAFLEHKKDDIFELSAGAMSFQYNLPKDIDNKKKWQEYCKKTYPVRYPEYMRQMKKQKQK